MSKNRIRAITFDLWDTVIVDDSDEPKRKAMGLASKKVTRRKLVREFLEKHEPIDQEKVNLAYDTADAAFRVVWYEQNVTWTVRQRIGVVLAGLGRQLPEEELAKLVRCHETMELEVKPDLVPGVEKALPILAERYKLGVISDAIFTPGWALREMLASYGLADYFKGFVFSDEAGASKPEPKTFNEAARLLGVDVKEIVHIGDREEKDITGPHNVGARGILLTTAKDRGSKSTRAEAVCKRYEDLPAILDRLEKGEKS